MTAHLPPVEPPADDVADLLELVRRARLGRADADHTLGHLQDHLRTQDLPPTAKLYFDVERIVGEHRLFLWGQVTAVLEAQARTLGLEP